MKLEAYIAYLSISAVFTVWVAYTLSRNGRVFLVDIFQGREDLADSVNHLLVVGFYLVNIGFILLTLKERFAPADYATLIEFLSHKLGLVIIVLGAMHFFNIYVLTRFRGSKANSKPKPNIADAF